MNKINKVLLSLVCLAGMGAGAGVNQVQEVGLAVDHKADVKRAYTNTKKYVLPASDSSFVKTYEAGHSYDDDGNDSPNFYYPHYSISCTTDEDNVDTTVLGTYDAGCMADILSEIDSTFKMSTYTSCSGIAIRCQSLCEITQANVDNSAFTGTGWYLGDYMPNSSSLSNSSVKDYVAESNGFYTYVVEKSALTADLLKTLMTNSATPSGDAGTCYMGLEYLPLSASTLTDGAVRDLYYYVPSVPSMRDILGGITAKDLFGVDCAVDCSDTERGKYSQAIGVYSVKITATDTYGQTATATLNIHIIDNGKPVIALASGKNLSFVSGSSSLKLADLPSYFTITDVGTSFGGNIGTPSYTYDGAPFADKTFGASDFGTHTVGVTVADSSGNSTTTNFSLSVTDGTAPVIARRDSSDVSTVIKIGVSRTFTLTKAEFLQIFKATDNVDGDLSADLDVEGDMFGNKVGNYSVKVVCSDKSGNKGSVTATVQVIADLPPVFILSDTLVQATTAQPLSTADLTSVVTNGILSGKTVTACSVNAGTYIGNENVAGDYTITYDATVASGTKSIKRAVATNDVSGSFILRVTKAAAENTDADTAHWYTPIVEFFQKLGNWFRGVFTKFKFDCFITNAEWDARFPAKVDDTAKDSTSTAPVVDDSTTAGVSVSSD